MAFKINELQYFLKIGDCSLISSFIILKDYENKFNINHLISKFKIYPDCYNPAGLYVGISKN